MKKRKIGFLSLVILCVAFTFLPVQSMAASIPFTDVPAGAWYENAAEQTVSKGLLDGTTSTSFGPEQTLTETDFLKGLYLAAGNQENTDAFYLNWGRQNGLTQQIVLDDKLTREEMVLMTYRRLRLNQAGTAAGKPVPLKYTDISGLSDEAKEAVLYCTAQGIVQGNPDGSLAPNAFCSRAEAAVVLYRYEKLVSDAQLQTLYTKAVEDAKTIEPEEILPVTAITKNSPLTTWNQAGDRVLMLTFHKYPDSYRAGTETKNSWGKVWVFTDKEMIQWFQKNKAGVTHWQLRFNQLIGLPPDNAYTHFSAVWVKPQDLIRPAYVTDITKSQMTSDFVGPVDADYKAWFQQNMQDSYDSQWPYPWTRLGYTYDWADNGTEFGLSEFIIKENSDLQVAFTDTVEEFVDWLEAQSSGAEVPQAA